MGENVCRGNETSKMRKRCGQLAALLLFALAMSFVGLVRCDANTPGKGAFDIEQRLSELSDDARRGGVVLVLSGGGTKGFAHVGVLEVLERENIPIVGIVGTSIGAVIGGLYATGYDAQELHTIIMETNIMGLLADSGTRIKPGAGDHRPVGESTKFFQANLNRDLKVEGPLGILPALSLVSFLTKYTGHIQTTDFGKLPIPFACVATDIGNGETVVLRDGNLASAIRASVAIPGLLEPWPLEGRLLVDGGLVANLPVEIAKDLFPGYPVIAVNLAGQSIEKSSDRFTSVVDILLQTIDVMTVEQLKKNESMADLVLYPDVSGFSMLDPGGYEEIYQRGLTVAEQNAREMVDLSAAAPLPPMLPPDAIPVRIVRGVRIEGLHRNAAHDIEAYYKGWIGKPYDIEKVNAAMELLLKREEIATVDVDTYPASTNDKNDIDVVFSVEKRSAFEIGFGGYTTNLHSHRWFSAMMNARDLASAGDSASFEARFGDNEEWGASMRYFTPLQRQQQWGFALNARKDYVTPYRTQAYNLERYSFRALHYDEQIASRFGIGVAGERSNALREDSFVWGPYLYYNSDTLDNALNPTSGHSITSQIWWNTADVFVSNTKLTGYIPLKNELHLVLDLGLKTGDKGHQAYRAMLGDQEELLSLARYPYYGDQAAWVHLGLGRNFYNSWWGSLRWEVFARYGLVMEEWEKTDDAWEAGVSFSVPGQHFNSRLLLIYDEDGEFTAGFSIGVPRWWSSQMP